jgi:hypothetical protein
LTRLASALAALAPLGGELVEVRPNDDPGDLPAYSYGGWLLAGPVESFHAAVDELEGVTVAEGYWNKLPEGLRRRAAFQAAQLPPVRAGMAR